MDKLQKLFRRIPRQDRLRLEDALSRLYLGKSTDEKQKLKGFDHIYRIRVGSYRVIFYDDGTDIILKAIKRRNEATYSDF